MNEINVYDIKGKETGKVSLDAQVFDGHVNVGLMHQAVTAYLANQRKGLACAKTRSEMSGSGRKLWRQKGTGRARVGSIRSPLWRGGGKTFGPRPHSFAKDLPQKMKMLALKSALNSQVKGGALMILSEFNIATPKTKELVAVIRGLKLEATKVCFVVDQVNKELRLSSRNIPNASIMDAGSLNTYAALGCRKLVLTKTALVAVSTRVKKGLQ